MEDYEISIFAFPGRSVPSVQSPEGAKYGVVFPYLVNVIWASIFSNSGRK